MDLVTIENKHEEVDSQNILCSYQVHEIENTIGFPSFCVISQVLVIESN